MLHLNVNFHIYACMAQVLNLNIHTCVVYPSTMAYICLHGHQFANDNGQGYVTQVHHVVKDGDDACIFVMWQHGDYLPHNVRITQLCQSYKIELIDNQIQMRIHITNQLIFIHFKGIIALFCQEMFFLMDIACSIMELM